MIISQLQEIIKELLKKFSSDIISLDILVQFSMNPTSSTAGYELERNRSYIEDNLVKTYLISKEESAEKCNNVYDSLNPIIKKFTVYEIEKNIEEAINNDYLTIFIDFFKQKLKNAPLKIHKLLYLLKKYPNSPWYSLKALYVATFDEDITVDEVISFGILKDLYWAHSKKPKDEVFHIFLPFFTKIMVEIQFQEFIIPKPDIQSYIETLSSQEIEELIRICQSEIPITTYYSGQSRSLRDYKYIIGSYSRYDRDGDYLIELGISVNIIEDLNSILAKKLKAKYKEESEIVLKILEFELKHKNLPNKVDLVRKMKVPINLVDYYLELVSDLINEKRISIENEH